MGKHHVTIVQSFRSEREQSRDLFRALAVGSAIAVLLLLAKYTSPPEFLGPLFSRAEILDDPVGGAGRYVPIPSVIEELSRHLENYFVLFGAILYFAVLGRRGIAWERCWTALLLASIALYQIADLVFVRLYVPNRYTRYSMLVLLVLWHAVNLDRILARIPRLAARRALLVALLVAAGLAYRGTAGRFVTYNGKYVERVASTRALILDTRKTAPGLRRFDKYAVRMGGGVNHRHGLSDGVLIKDNHIAAAGSIANAVGLARKNAPHTLRVETEVEDLEGLREALDAGADIILLDNMTVEQMRAAVQLAGGRVMLEASGGVNLETVRAIAETGVDAVSVGALTHSVRAADLSLDIISST